MSPTNQPQPPVDQPAAQPTSPYGPPSQHYPPTAIDPGKNMGIIGMVLAFVFPFVGIVLSITSRSKSVKAGYSGGLGLAGIIINSVAILLWSLSLIIAIVVYQGVQERANEAAARTQTEILKIRSAED